jgi:hypothetical protein
VASPTGSHPNARVARAAALAELNKTTSDITSALFPEQLFEAEQKVTIALTPWQPIEGQNLVFRGRLQLTLSERDLAHSREFAAARRAALLPMVAAEDASASLRETHLSDITKARVWWLRQYLDQPGSDVSWKAFDEHVRPLVTDSIRTKDDIDRLAHVILTATGRISEDPRQRKTLLQVLEYAFNFMDWRDLASEMSEFEHDPG